MASKSILCLAKLITVRAVIAFKVGKVFWLHVEPCNRQVPTHFSTKRTSVIFRGWVSSHFCSHTFLKKFLIRSWKSLFEFSLRRYKHCYFSNPCIENTILPKTIGPCLKVTIFHRWSIPNFGRPIMSNILKSWSALKSSWHFCQTPVLGLGLGVDLTFPPCNKTTSTL